VVDGSWKTNSGQFQPDADALENSHSAPACNVVTETCHEKDCLAVCKKEAPWSEVEVRESSIKQEYSKTEDDGNSSSTSVEYEEIDRYLSTIDSTEMAHGIISNEAAYSSKLEKPYRVKPEDVNDGSNQNVSTEDNCFQCTTPSAGQEESDMKLPGSQVKRWSRRKKACSQVGVELDGSHTKETKDKKRVKQIDGM